VLGALVEGGGRGDERGEVLVPERPEVVLPLADDDVMQDIAHDVEDVQPLPPRARARPRSRLGGLLVIVVVGGEAPGLGGKELGEGGGAGGGRCDIVDDPVLASLEMGAKRKREKFSDICAKHETTALLHGAQ
jgi:hypothetical protein